MSGSASRGRAPRPPVAADGLLHPVALVALATLVLNDHALKGRMPPPLTGILSDVAGIVLLPLVLQAAWEIVLARRWAGPSRRAIAVACLATGIGFAVVEMLPAASEVYQLGLGVLQWPASAIAALASSRPLPPVRPVAAVSDPWDLLALPALAIPWWVGVGRAGRATRSASTWAKESDRRPAE